ncbi:MAG: hypothetical protein AAGF26_06925 [Cyanobacteria bacterium P01_G01_bin.49]
MVKASNEPLQPNPFCTYRDPKTGLWVVVPKSPTDIVNHKSSEDKFSV